MAELTLSRTVVLATLAAIAVGLATPAFAVTQDRTGVERRDFVYVPVNGNCVGRPWCDLARYSLSAGRQADVDTTVSRHLNLGVAAARSAGSGRLSEISSTDEHR